MKRASVAEQPLRTLPLIRDEKRTRRFRLPFTNHSLPPAILFIVVYLASVGYLIATGEVPLDSFAMQSVLLIFLLLTYGSHAG